MKKSGQGQERYPKPSCKFFHNRDCEFLPCHRGWDRIMWDFNCLFCFCPLYDMTVAIPKKYGIPIRLPGERLGFDWKKFDCGGDYTIKDGQKDCSPCLIVHRVDAWDYVMKKLKEKNGH